MEFLIGLFIGGLLFWLFFERRKPSGTFVIDFSDVNKDFCTINLDKGLDELYYEKYILLRVQTIEYNSQR